MYRDNKEIGGRPHNDELLMIKMLVLVGWHGLSDYEGELLATDRLSFRYFLGYPEKIPARCTVWLFRENLTTKGKIHLIWDELQRQLDDQGYSIKRGTIQDASFITSDPGHAKADTPRGDAEKTRRSRDGTWARKGKKSPFGYKLHSLIDKEYPFVRRFDTSTASLHDNQVDLSQKGETVYRDKRIFRHHSFRINRQNYEESSPGKTDLYEGQTQKPGNQQNTSSRGTTVCWDQTGVSCRACDGYHSPPGPC